MATGAQPEHAKDSVTPPAGSIENTSPTAAEASSSSSKADIPAPATARHSRPMSIGFQPGSIIVHRDAIPMPTPQGEYPPDDARAMSPRRTSDETNKLGEETRLAVQKHARTLQDGLSAIADKIEAVKADNAKLERDNLALQDYIGGLTQSMSRTNLASSSSSASGSAAAGASGGNGGKK